MIENPAIADWFFYYRILKFIEALYVRVLEPTNYWMRFEWQHRSSPHVHSLAWLSNAPDVEKLLSVANGSDEDMETVTQCADSIVSTCNPAVLPDGSNVYDAPTPKTDPICNQRYTEVQDFDQDLACCYLPMTHPMFCSILLAHLEWTQECRFGYPKPLQPSTALVTDESEPRLLTACNDGMRQPSPAMRVACQCRHAVRVTAQSNPVLQQVCHQE